MSHLGLRSNAESYSRLCLSNKACTPEDNTNNPIAVKIMAIEPKIRNNIIIRRKFRTNKSKEFRVFQNTLALRNTDCSMKLDVQALYTPLCYKRV